MGVLVVHAFVDAKNIEDMIKTNREWFSKTINIVTEQSSNAFKIFQDAASKFISSEKTPVAGMMEKAEEAVKIVEEAAA